MADLPESQPAHGPRDRRPQPLLSRAKLRPPRDLPPADPAAPAEAGRPRRKRSAAARAIGLLAGVAVLAGLGGAAAHFFRQTQLQGLIVAPGAVLPQEVCLVSDFSDDLRTLRQEFKLSDEPFERDARTKADTLQRVQADLAGLDERKHLIAADVASREKEIHDLLAATQESVQKVWEEEGGAIDKEYAQRLENLRQGLAARATQLGVTVDLDPQNGSPDTWVNSFHLALYNPPATVKPVPEREWLEKQLADWHAYEEAVDKRHAGLKEKADALRKQAAPKIDAITAEIAQSNGRIDEAERTAAPLRSEHDVLQTEADGARERARQQRQAYADQLLQVPKQHIREKFPLGPDGRFRWTNVQEDGKYPPGDYLLWASLRRNGVEYWALVPFPVKAGTRIDLIIDAKAFVSAAALLQ